MWGHLSKQFQFGLLCVFLWSCGGSKHELNVGDGSSLDKKLEIRKLLSQPDQISFEHVNNFVFKDSCVRCHNSSKRSGQVDLSSYRAVIGKVENSRRVVEPFQPDNSELCQSMYQTNGKWVMPPSTEAPLSEEQKDLVYQWVEKGARLNAGETQSEIQPLSEELQSYFDHPEKVDYRAVNKYVFTDGACLKCHSTKFVKFDDDAITDGVDLTSYQTMIFDGVVKGVLVDKFKKKPDGTVETTRGSKVYKAVAVNQSMPPALKYKPLDSLRVKLLRLWILNCAVETIPENDNLLSEPKHSGKVRLCDGEEPPPPPGHSDQP